MPLHTGDSRWVTGETARRHVHETRNRLPAIMVGIGTVLEDDPLLTCRIDGGRDPIRVICDSRARTPIDSDRTDGEQNPDPISQSSVEMSAPLNWNGTVYTFSNAKRKTSA